MAYIKYITRGRRRASLFLHKKTPPRRYEAGAENTRNIRAIYGDKYKRAIKPAKIAFLAYK